MKFMIKSLSGVLLILILFSCNNLRQLTTYWESDLENDTLKPTGFDPLTRVGWTSYNDSSHLFLAIDMLSQPVQMSVLRNGLTIFIDTTARLKENCYLKFPSNGSEFRIQSPEGGRSRTVGRMEQQPRINPIDNMLANFDSFKLEWKQGGKVIQTNPNRDDNDFICLAALDSMNYMSFLIGIPLEKIHPQGFDGIDEFSVGFGIPISGMGGMGARGGQGQSTMGSPQMDGSSGGGRMGGGGGGRGGRGGGSMGGGNMGAGQMEGGMASSGPTVEKFWYRTTLGKAIRQLGN
jgi:hypothetical protein